MRIKLKIDETSKVEVVPCDECEAIQGECCVTVLELEYPETINGNSIDSFDKYIEFAEVKGVGPCVKFFDEINGDKYELKEPATNFRKLRLQFKFRAQVDERTEIIWKSKIVELDFGEAINAENTAEIQSQLLSLKEIEDAWMNDLNTTKKSWEAFIDANCFRVVSKVENVPTADASNLSKTIFYLGANTTDPYTLTYGHYYRCNYVNDVYEWTDLTQDPSLADVANGIREISRNQTMQVWSNTKEEYESEEKQPNVLYMIEDEDIKETFNEVLTEMAEDENYKIAYPIIKGESGVLKVGDTIIPQKKLIWKSDTPVQLPGSGANQVIAEVENYSFFNKKLEFHFHFPTKDLYIPVKFNVKTWVEVYTETEVSNYGFIFYQYTTFKVSEDGSQLLGAAIQKMLTSSGAAPEVEHWQSAFLSAIYEIIE